MNYIIKIIFLLPILFVASCTIPSPVLLSQNGEVYKGIKYKKIDDVYGTTAHLIEVDPQQCSIHLIKASPLEYTTVLSRKSNALVGLNAGYFHSNGSPAGALKIKSNWIGHPSKNRGGFGWKNKTTSESEAFYFNRFDSASTNLDIWNEMDYVVGGIPLLIKDGQIVDPEVERTLSSFIERKYARSAIGLTQERKILLVVVEGGDSFVWNLGMNSGMSIYELSHFLISQGCIEAINLDGGRSSTMVIKNQMVNKQPFIYTERMVSDILAVIPRRGG